MNEHRFFTRLLFFAATAMLLSVFLNGLVLRDIDHSLTRLEAAVAAMEKATRK